MTRSLYVLRHGKSDWEAPHGDDHERPLKKRGRLAAKQIGVFLTHIGEEPEVVLSSSAVRARVTAEVAAEAGDWSAPLEVTRALYEATADSVLERLHGVRDEYARALLVGHEPTSSSLIAVLTKSAAPAFPTAALARIDLAVESWKEVEPGRGILVWLVNPRLLDPFLKT